MISSVPECDLHPYIRDPHKARAILDKCIEDSLEKGVTQIRVIHGKGKGDFRKLIHSHLDKHPSVVGHMLCDPLHGGSGATWAHLIGESPESVNDQGDEIQAKDRPKLPLWRWPLYLAFLLLAFMVFPQWFFRGLLMLFIFWLEIRMTTAHHDE